MAVALVEETTGKVCPLHLVEAGRVELKVRMFDESNLGMPRVHFAVEKKIRLSFFKDASGVVAVSPLHLEVGASDVLHLLELGGHIRSFGEGV